MNKYYKEILEELKKAAGDRSRLSGNDNYLSSGHKYLSIRNPRKKMIAHYFKNRYKSLSHGDFIYLLDQLYDGQFYEEKTITGEILRCFSNYRHEISLLKLDEWLGKLNGWAEIDSTCQGIFTADEILSRWSEWECFLLRLANDENINKRRASLVLLTSPVGHSSDLRLVKLSLMNIDSLKAEKNILISKAISWLLRSLIRYNRAMLVDYLQINENNLPAIAIRETKNKLTSGKK